MTRIPIFPLEVVLFPGEILPLHIFEPRYKEMIRECDEKKQPFGVVLAVDDGLAEVACTAELLQIAKTYANGEMDIITIGRRVCRIVELIEERSFYEADVEYLEDAAPPKQVPSTALLQLFEKCYHATFQQGPDFEALAKAPVVSYYMAAGLPLDLTYKQKLLEMQDEEERRHSLEINLARWLEQLEVSNRARRLSGGNGHPHYS
jgi:ATP-dependent Lon protease